MKYNSIFILICLAVSIFYSCEKEPINESELITSLSITLQAENGGAPVILSFFDPDGDGGTEPLITDGVLSNNTNYQASITILDESKIPAHTLTDIIFEEALDHQFFYSTSGSLDLQTEYQDADVNGNPIGINTKFITGNNSSGILTITLRHQPDKLATGVKNGDITNAGGETDIEVNFKISIQ